jgi:hypothetical protein
MSHYIKSVLTASLLAAALLVSEPASPQTHVPVKQETILTFAHDLLQVFYPELFDKNHRVTLCVTAPGDDTLLETTLGSNYPASISPLPQRTFIPCTS